MDSRDRSKSCRSVIIGLAWACLGAIPASLAGQTPVDVHVVEDPPANADGAAGFDVAELEKRGLKPLRCKSKKEMVDQALGALKKGECLKNLYLYGHGAPGDISLGSGTKSVKCQYINGNRADWEDLLKQLKPKLCEGANVYLLGCNVGAGDAGAKKLQELAEVTPFTWSLLVYPLIALLLALRGRPRLRVALAAVLFLVPTLAHVFLETPVDQFRTWAERPDVNLLHVASPALGAAAAAVSVLLTLAALATLVAFWREAARQ